MAETQKGKLQSNSADRALVAVDDLAAMMRLLHHVYGTSENVQECVSATVSGLVTIFGAEAACLCEISHDHPPLQLIEELHRHRWTDAHSADLMMPLNGHADADFSIAGIIRRHGSHVFCNGASHRSHYLASSVPVESHRHLILAFARKDEPFCEREVLLLRTYQQSPSFELIGRRRTTAMPSALTNRSQEVLAALRTGKSEKEIAVGLNLSRHTVHVYVKGIYRSHGVNSRAELLSLSIPDAAKHPCATIAKRIGGCGDSADITNSQASAHPH